IGNAFGVRTDVLYTNMNQPLGRFSGVWCEVLESVDVLNGTGPEDTRILTLELGARLMIQSGKVGDVEAAKQILREHLRNGSAYGKFLEMVAAQGGNPDDFQTPDQLNQPGHRAEVRAPETGVIQSLDTTRLGG
ncbi:MAG: pyrimidine-nucleoside phosphorylase, partial [FCB group bacterium]|nr:pyrimidine-nucleoside phosphorylase [FCB group bacterium]